MNICRRDNYLLSLLKLFPSSPWKGLFDQFDNGGVFFLVGVCKRSLRKSRHYIQLSIAVVGLLCASAELSIAGNFYFDVIAPNGTVIPVGPYPNYSVAADTFGSALYA